MTMFTRCTACGATFRVTLDHLQASAGQVRCGVCQTVFDAFVSLSANDPRSAAAGDGGDDARGAPPAPAAMTSARDAGMPPPSAPSRDDAPVPQVTRPEAAAADVAPPPLPASASAAAPAPMPVPGSGAVAASAPPDLAGDEAAPRQAGGSQPAVREPLARFPEPSDRAVDAPARAATEPVAPVAPPPSVDSPRSPSQARGGGSATAVVLLLCGAAALQGAYFLRAELAARVPALRPWLEQACEPLGCEVPLARATEQLSIEGSDLQALDPARPGRVLLTATIRNRAPFLQAWPMLELTLTNARDQVGIRRVFSAAEYLAPAAPGAGIGPGAEATVKMRLDARELQPSGYRLYLFHP